MADVKTILTRLLTSLSVSDPTWDTSVGSATYKIMESVAQELANVANNSTLLSFGMSINTKAGVELDTFVNLFGINRQLGTRSVGYVTFSTNVNATQDYQIPLGTTVFAPSSINGANIGFTTTSPAILAEGAVSVQVPVICILPGTLGNIGAGTLTGLSTPLSGITSVINESSFSGGSDGETDAQLRQRFLNTAFSNFAGTSSKYFSVAKQLPSVNRIKVVTSQNSNTESLQVYTLISGNSNFNLGINTKAILSVSGSGATSATLVSGQLPVFTNMNIVSGTVTPSGATLSYDGETYTLSSGALTSGNFYVNHTISGTTSLNGSSTPTNINSEITTLLTSGGYSVITPTTSGSTVSAGLSTTFSQGTPWNLIVASGSVTATNIISSLTPDSKYSYPAGGESVGINFGSSSQNIFVRNVDYSYVQVTGTAPLTQTVSLSGNYANVPYTNTGQILQLSTQYIPITSRVVVSGASIINPNYVDIFIDDTTTSSTTEQIIVITGSSYRLNASSGNYYVGNFTTASGGTPVAGDIYIDLSQGPVANFPNQVVNNVAPNYMTFGTYNYPLSLTRVTGQTVGGFTGTSGNNIITTASTISGLQPGLVAFSGSAYPAGTYITSITSGIPNQIVLNNNLTSALSNSSIKWATVAYPVYDNTNTRGSINDITGIAVVPTDPTGQYNNDYLTKIDYQVGSILHDYYSNVAVIDNVEQQARTVGIDLLVHQVEWVNLTVNLTLVYNTSNTVPSTNNAIQNSISAYLNRVPIGTLVSLSNILQAVYSTNGVSMARITISGDNPNNYGVLINNLDGSVKSGPYLKDISLNANQAPRLRNVNFQSLGFNNF